MLTAGGNRVSAWPESRVSATFLDRAWAYAHQRSVYRPWPMQLTFDFNCLAVHSWAIHLHLQQL